MYCNAACKKRHRHKHKKECEEHLKQAAELAAMLHDEKLFKQPPPLEDCPICMIRLPSRTRDRSYMACCGKVICRGCIYAPVYDHQGNEVDNQKCPFCRTLPPRTDEEKIKRYEKRIKLKDPIAMFIIGIYYSTGEEGLPQDQSKALELFYQAGKLGYSMAYGNIGHAYEFGTGEGVKDDSYRKRSTHYLELAAMGGSIASRFNLGCNEWQAGNYERAIKHWMIAVKDGDPDSLEYIKKCTGMDMQQKTIMPMP